jgi:hypothetical protein
MSVTVNQTIRTVTVNNTVRTVTVTYPQTGSGGGVTSVAVSGSDGIEVDSGSPITSSGTIALGLNKANTLSFLNVEDGATADQTDAEIVASWNTELSLNAQSGFLGFDTANANWRGFKGDVSGALMVFPVNAGRVLFNNTNLAFASGINVGFSSSGSFSASAFPTLDVYWKRRAAGEMELVGTIFAKAIRMTTTKRDALSLTSSDNYIIFNTTTNKLQAYDGTTWNDLY